MYPASVVFSRLLFIAAVALPSYVLVAGMECQRSGGCDRAQQVGVQLDDAAFGIDHWLEGEGYVFTETDHLHLEPGTSFGWRLKLRSPVEGVLLREEFVLPAAPAYWGLGPDTRLSDDRRTAVTERMVSALDGSLASQWTVTPGDPPGRYEMRIFLDDELIKTFKFEAHEPHE